MEHPLIVALHSPGSPPSKAHDHETWSLPGNCKIIVRRDAGGRVRRCEPRDPGAILVGACFDTPSNRDALRLNLLTPAEVHDAEGGAS